MAEHHAKTRDELVATPDDPLAGPGHQVRVPGRLRTGRSLTTSRTGFEEAFHGFVDPALNAAMSEEEFDAHLKDTRIIRNAQKVASVRANAQFMVDLAHEQAAARRPSSPSGRTTISRACWR